MGEHHGGGICHLQCASMAVRVAFRDSSAAIAAFRKRKLHEVVEYLSGTIVTCTLSKLGYTEYPGDVGNRAGDLAESNFLLLRRFSAIGGF